MGGVVVWRVGLGVLVSSSPLPRLEAIILLG